jgi:tartrate-resistant acid phosphatase type 5
MEVESSAWPGNLEVRKFIYIVLSLAALALPACMPQAAALQVTPQEIPATLAQTPRQAPLTAVATDALSLPLVIAEETPTILPTITPTATPTSEPPVRFAVIGDFGLAGQAEADVAALVVGWQPDFVITLGDNNYPDGAAETIDENIGQYYHAFIFPYTGSYGTGADENRFFPTLGNHDWNTSGAQPYLDYFDLPGNERYYEFTRGPIHFFALDSDSREPDGVGSGSVQGAWLQEKLAAATLPWKIVYMHHPPYSSGLHGPVDWTRWPYQEWGATAVLSGHDHTYERLSIDGFPYFVNGLGGGAVYAFPIISEGSVVRYNDDYGAMLVIATPQAITFQFITRAGEVIDTYTITAPTN